MLRLYDVQPDEDYSGPEFWLNRIHPEDRKHVQEVFQKSKIENTDYQADYRIVLPDGTIKYQHSIGYPILNDSGDLMEFVGMAIDVTEQWEAKEALRLSERNLGLMIGTIPGFIWLANPAGEVDYMNERILGFFNATLEDVVGVSWSNFLHPDDLDRALREWSLTVATGKRHESEFRLRLPNGGYRWFQSLSEPLRDPEGRILRWYGLVLDIDERKNMEEALRRTQTRLSRATQIATVGELAASIAHEINQPLAAVVASGHACLHFLSAQPPSVAKGYEAAESIVRDGKEAGEVVRCIRALFKRGAVEKVMLDLNDVIGEVLRLLGGETTRRRVAVETDLGKDLPAVAGDRVQLQQLVLNLLLNGIEAMDPVLDRSRKLLVRSKRNSADTVLVEVRDCGVGLRDPARVFEAFVTTKENGMGMGLAICRSIVEAHNGRLWAASGEGPGATFCFTLPL